MSRLTVAAAAFAALSTPALAGPVEVPPPPPPVVIAIEEPFEGPYVGLEYGHVMGDGEYDFVPFELENGTAYGVFGGYNLQNGGFVYGGELRYLAFDGAVDTGAFAGNVEVTDALDLRARLGFAVGDFLGYGAIGLSRVGFTDGGDSTNLTGHNVGLGAEYNVSQQFFLGIDYTAREVEGDLPGGPANANVNTLTLRGGFRF